ncbi:MAG: DUF493 domain-containing protein [Betaproteobacteria bacterium]|nr:DUF493 domain-containing protein [Betaproteobacteria bacterium]
MSESLLVFPCAFPIKVMGVNSDVFTQEIVEIVRIHAPDFAAESVQMRASAGGNYLAVTCTIRADSRSQLDDLYRALSAHPGVKVVL